MSWNLKKVMVIIIAIVLISFSAFAAIFKSVIEKPLKIENDEVIIIEEGESFYNFLDELKAENKVKNIFVIKSYAKLKNINLDIIPGNYIINEDMTLMEMIELLKNDSDLNMVNFTVPEGFTINDIATKLEEEEVCKAEDFLLAVENYPLPNYVKKIDSKRYQLEGYLFPDTYKVKKGIEPEYIVELLVQRFEEVWNEITTELGEDINVEDIERIITIASIIEKEARVDDERATIASVIQNRIDSEMPLQIDATVIYAHGYHKDKLYYKDLEIDSPYNTYLYGGLPIGPISNPGAPSIIAALKPENTNYLFYVLETDKRHYFTDDYEDFMNKQEELGY